MRCVVQRVTRSSVTVDGAVVSEIGKGLNVLCGVERDDTEADCEYIARKLFDLRIFDDSEGKTNLSITDRRAAGEDVGLLLISQFTLMGDARHGKRPSFSNAMEYNAARDFFERFAAGMKARCDALGICFGTGEFGGDMKVLIDNDGPFTILLDSKKLF
ncbi:MAG: D-tyrosyl-tRNA(Tyr) deacylase [Clostridia bacterium]|nr:D-tyrosyl-tRNA(Tyr) deacylase [Clostridia bacterium]